MSSPSSTTWSSPILPDELLDHIVKSYVDRPTAIVLARTSRRFAAATERIIWRELKLYAPDFTGEYNDGYDGVLAWQVEDKARAGLRVQARGVLLASSSKRCGLVDRITIAPRPGSYHEIFSILGLVADSLQRLDIETPYDEFFGRKILPDDPETIDINLIDCGLSFRSLTHIRLGPSAIRFAETMDLLCSAAPNLTALDACLYEHLFEAEGAVGFPHNMPKTKIQRLRLNIDPDNNCKRRNIAPVCSFVQRCPKLREFHLDFEDRYGYAEATLKVAAYQPDLQDLYRYEDLEEFVEQYKGENEGFCGNVRRLYLRASTSKDFLSHLPALPNLEVLYISARFLHREVSEDLLYPSPEGPTQLILPDLAVNVRKSPKLRTICVSAPFIKSSSDVEFELFRRLDDFEKTPQTGFIASYQHGDSELLHLHLPLDFKEMSDRPDGQSVCEEEGHHERFHYTSVDGSARVKSFGRIHSGLEWQDWTDFEGVAVPLEVIERMRVVEGMEMGEWRKRGVELGEEAWKVLTDWKAQSSPVSKELE